MVEQAETQIQIQPQSRHQPQTDSSTTTTITTQQPPPLTDTSSHPPPSSTSSETPLRPKKVRKLSSTTTAKNPNPKTPQPTTNTKLPIRVLPRIVSKPLSCEGEINLALRHLRSIDPQLARLIDLHLPPSFDSFHPPFLALSKSIIYQQLAFKAGTSIYTRFVSLCGGESSVLPEIVLSLTPHQLRQVGVSGRKASYLHDLANKYNNGILSDESIIDMDDKSLFTMLTMVNGIGPWSVHMFMIFSLHRPDVLPVGDVGIRKGVQLLLGLEQLPKPSQMEHLCAKWRPYRSVASWYMWRLAEANGSATTAPAVAIGESQQQQQQQQQQLPQQPLDQIGGITNLGAAHYWPF